MLDPTADNVTTWRELSDQLTPAQIHRFERWERDALVSINKGHNRSDSPEDITRCFLTEARREVEANLNDALFDVSLPADATHAEHWEDDGTGRWSRLVIGARHDVAHLAVGITGIQIPDGSVVWTAYAHADDIPATPEQLRQYAAALVAAAAELDRLQ